MKNFADSLVRKIRELENPTVMGLDPRLEYIPEEIRNRWNRI
jgi:orotidine-5'-phosphate decarboxylase